MDRNQASFSPAGGGARRSEAKKARLTGRPDFLCALVGVLGSGSVATLAALVTLGPVLPVAAASWRSPAAVTAHGAVSAGSTNGSTTTGLRLVDQSSSVKPSQMFDMTLAISSQVPRTQLGIALSVYSPPDGQSSFDETLNGNTSSESLVSDTAPVELSALSTDSSGNFEVQAGITSGDFSAPPATFNLDLQCAPESCGGVYPLRVQLMNTATGSVVVDLVTYIVFVESNVASRLRVALVVPLGTEPSEPAESGIPGPPTGSGLTRLTTTVGEISNSDAPLTILAQPETVQALAGGPAAAKSVAQGIVAISDEAALEVLPSPYVWVDPAVLVANGLSTELAAQSVRGDQMMNAERVQTSGDATVVEGALDDQTLQALSADGTSHVVVPSDDLEAVTGRFAGPSVQTFTLPVAQGRTIEAAQTDPTLESELTDQQGAGDVLAAHQLLADLALVAFEEPEASWARGVVLVPPLNWSPSSAFLTVLLSGLDSIHVLKPVTLSSFFTQVTRGDDGGNTGNGNGWPSTRKLAKEGGAEVQRARAFRPGRSPAQEPSSRDSQASYTRRGT